MQNFVTSSCIDTDRGNIDVMYIHIRTGAQKTSDICVLMDIMMCAEVKRAPIAIPCANS
jgi:hypothetical protein